MKKEKGHCEVNVCFFYNTDLHPLSQVQINSCPELNPGFTDSSESKWGHGHDISFFFVWSFYALLLCQCFWMLGYTTSTV